MKLTHRAPSFAVLIPSRGRAELLQKNLTRKMPFLDRKTTYIGVEIKEWNAYKFLQKMKVTTVLYRNRMGSVAVAREALKQAAERNRYPYVVVTDDNAVYTAQSLTNLVECTKVWNSSGGACIVAGMHGTAAHFDRRLIDTTLEERSGLRSYRAVAMIFQCYPMTVYRSYSYPEEAFGLDDRHFYLWCIQHNHCTHFRVCMNAPFTKARYQEGGQGPIHERAWKNGRAISKLAWDFPELVGVAGTLRIPWQLILQMKKGKVPDRLAGGAMRTTQGLLRRSQEED